VQFVFVAPKATEVSLVGDFNDWDASKTRMVRADQTGHWTVTLPLTAGRHLYAFVVDGTTWRADPSAPIAGDDDFGHTNSVKVVQRGSAL
jgi:1,4-alpha-glucan branching enzyme